MNEVVQFKFINQNTRNIYIYIYSIVFTVKSFELCFRLLEIITLYCYNTLMEMVALCAIGAEHILAQELKHLGVVTTGNKKGRVYFKGDDYTLYKSLINLRCADKVFLLLSSVRATNFDELFDAVKNIKWELYFRRNTKVTVDKVRTHYSHLSSQHSIQSITQKAIYSHLMATWNMQTLPETGDEHFVRIYIEKDNVEVLLDVTGEALYKRGYKVAGGVAPLRETVACVLLQKMLWKRKLPLIDPFCGSGTIPLEATLYALNVAPGLFRKFSFEYLSNFNSDAYQKIRNEAIHLIRTDVTFSITGIDIDKNAISGAQKNAAHLKSMIENVLKSAGFATSIKMPQFICCDYKDAACYNLNNDALQNDTQKLPLPMIICNPPYGERIGDSDDAKHLYQEMRILREKFHCGSLGVITTHKDFEEDFNEKAKKVSALKAGSFDTYFYQYN